MYYMNFTLADIEDCNLLELKWTHSWLVEQKRQEAEAIEKQLKSNL